MREFVQRAASELGFTVEVCGEGMDEVSIVIWVEGDKARRNSGDRIVKIDTRYFRPTEVETRLCSPSKAKLKLGLEPTTTFEKLVREMVQGDYTSAQRHELVKMVGFQTFDFHEVDMPPFVTGCAGFIRSIFVLDWLGEPATVGEPVTNP